MASFTTQGVIIGIKKHAEKNTLVFLFTQDYGMCVGIVRNGQSKSQQMILQIGNQVNGSWHARLRDHLGEWRLEPVKQTLPFIIQSSLKLKLLDVSASLLLKTLPEQHPYPKLYEFFLIFLEHLRSTEKFLQEYVLLELYLLRELGFGLDLTKCAVTHTLQNLTHISPKTGRAVCYDVALPYQDKLLIFPKFLQDKDHIVTEEDLQNGLDLTGYFIQKHFASKHLESILNKRNLLKFLV